MEITRIFDLLERYREKFPGHDAFACKKDGQWITYTAEQYCRFATSFACGLLALGFRKGDKILTVTNNRPEWNFADMGMAMAGVVHVPVFTSLSNDDYTYILDHSDARMVIAGDPALYKKIAQANRSVDADNIYTFDDIPGARSWMDIVSLGEKMADKFIGDLERRKTDIQADDPATLIYTSGTTGTPKGVLLSHKNLVRNFLAAAEVFCLTSSDKYLSILPLCHVGGRLGNYQTQYSGSTIYYAENMSTIASNMKEIRADGFDAVPRILEKIISTVIARGEKLTGLKRLIFFWAVSLGFRYKTDDESSRLYRLKLRLADKLVFSKWREALGGRVRLVGCGGASLQPRIERIFWAAGIKAINMYGLTETSPIITINKTTLPDVKLGTVGTLIDGVQVKIADDGEILCKGHNVMLGYYKDPEMTRAAFDEDGWFRTGDIGCWVDNRFLKITDRKKEIFKLSNGKFVAPQIIENKFRESVYIDQVMVVGENEKFASAIISPNFSYLEQWCETEKIPVTDKNSLIRLPQVQKMISDDINRINKALSEYEKIVKFRLVPEEWSPLSGQLSPTLKLRRSFILNRYSHVLADIYQKHNY